MAASTFVKQEPIDDDGHLGLGPVPHPRLLTPETRPAPPYNEPPEPAMRSQRPAYGSAAFSLPYRPGHHPLAAGDPDSVPFQPRIVQSQPAPIEQEGSTSAKSGALCFNRRAKQEDGSDAPTVCFEGALLFAPHRHHLLCGHFISTKNVEPCGSNCKISMTANSKCKIQGFLCPAPTCKKLRSNEKKAMPRLQHRGRKCDLSLMHGGNEQSDKKRIDRDEATALDTSNQVGMDGPGPRGRKLRKRKMDTRQRSRSPAADRITGSSRRARTPPRLPTVIEREAELISKYGRDVIETLRARMILSDFRKSPSDNFVPFNKMQELLQNERFVRELRNLHINGKTPFTPSARHWVQDAKRTSDAETSMQYPDAHAQPENATGDITRRQFAFDHSVPVDVHDAMEVEEEDVRMEVDYTTADRLPRAADNAQSACEETYCACESQADGFMVQCRNCDVPYHPSCIGKGIFTTLEYESERRKRYLKEDAAYVRGLEKYTCLNCDREQAQLGWEELFGNKRLATQASQRGPTADSGYCICHAKENDPSLVKCVVCDRWFHPDCIGKGFELEESDLGAKRKQALQADMKAYREYDWKFSCRECEGSANAARKSTNLSATEGLRRQAAEERIRVGKEYRKYKTEYVTAKRVAIEKNMGFHETQTGRRPTAAERKAVEAGLERQIKLDQDAEEQRNGVACKQIIVVQSGRHYKKRCDGCNEEMSIVRFECKMCLAYSLCEDCIGGSKIRELHKHSIGQLEALTGDVEMG